jgi:putative ABC transport system permease protein
LDWIGIIETAGQQGLLLGLVSLSVALSFRVLDFPDLTVDGSFALGGAVTATMIASGFNPILATAVAVILGSVAGALTGILNAKMRISRILAGILVMTMLYTINLRIMGRPNVSLLNVTTILSPFERSSWPRHLALIGFYCALVFTVKLLLDLLFRTNYGLLLLATGNNERSTLSAGSDPGAYRVSGLAIANALTALAGAVLAQSFGFADVGMGLGIIVIGFASLLIGEAILPPRTVFRLTLAAVLGSFIYQVIAATCLRMGLAPTDLKLATSILVIVVLSLQSLRKRGSMMEGV